jgi:hypothetical protein
MKKYLSIVLLIGVVLGSLTFESCKKGPNDPFLSLRSRKARMVGDWIISKYSKEYTQIFIGGEQFYYKIVQDGEGVAETLGYANYPGKDTTWTWDGKIIQDRGINFDKDGKVTYKWHYYIDEFYPDLDEDATMLFDSTVSYERIYYNTGTWNFLKNIDDFKNKERVSIMWEYVDFEEIYNLKIVTYDPNDDELLPVETNSTTREQSRSYYDNGEYTETWILDKLKNKELMMYRIIDQNTKVNEGTAATVNTTTDGLEQYDLEQE